MVELVALAAVAEDGTIGDDGEMPWHHPADLERFRKLTMGHPVIMGRRTWESLPELDGRVCIVLSRQAESFGNVSAGSIQQAINEAANVADTAYVIGGESVYRQMLPYCSRAELTQIPGEYNGDAKFPELDDEWSQTNTLALRDGLVVELWEREA